MKSFQRASAIAAVLLAASAVPHTGQSLRGTAESPTRHRTRPKIDTELQREIAEHNRQVEYRKAEKRARKARQGQEPG